MKQATWAAALFLAGASLSMLSACGDGPTGPQNGAGVTVMTKTEVIGPSTMEPGATASFTLRSTWSDGSSRDVSSEGAWISSNPGTVSISASGVATAHARGESIISGASGGVRSSRVVTVVPAGTYRLSGFVTEGATSIRVLGARVEAISDAGTLSATTGHDGTFALFGVAPSAELRVSHEGYALYIQRLALSDHALISVSLTPKAPIPDISGTYALTISADGCQATVPEELRRRTYTATVTQRPDHSVSVTLSGATFVGAVFSGSASAAGARFRLRDAYYGYYGQILPDVVERLPDLTLLKIAGEASLTQSADGLRGMLNGTLSHTKAVPQGAIMGQCGSLSHGFVMTRHVP